jgi:hypothetical protein
MSRKHNFWIAGLAAGVAMPAAALQDDRQRGGSPARWTSPGWYLVEHRGSGQADLLVAGPFAAEAACREARRTSQPPPPPGHPELDTLDCRELRQAP